MIISKDYINPKKLSELSKEEQINEMRTWFLENYQDPAQSCPYESSEGGYLYIWGGPYDTEDILKTEFYSIVNEETIDELVDELNTISTEWSDIPPKEEQDYSDILSREPIDIYTKSIDVIANLVDLKIDKRNRKTLLNMIYAQSITAMEAYLSDFFIKNVLSDESLLKKFVGNNDDFKREKFTISQIFNKYDNIQSYCFDYLNKIVWHNLTKVKHFYEITFDIKFPKDITEIKKAISTRHDIVHRNGKRKDGTNINVSQKEITQLISTITQFVEFIDKECKKIT